LKFITRQISLEAPALIALGVHDQNRRGPNRIEAAKVLGIFFYVDVKRDEVLVDVGCQTGIAV
jgi:hypothetical protein